MASPTQSNFPNQSGAFRLEMHYWYVGQSIVTNQSSFGWSVWVKKNRAYSMNSSSGSSVSASFNGVTVLSRSNIAYDLTGNDEVLLGSGTVTIAHQPDGSFGAAGVQASADFTYLGATTTPMETISAPTIPRASVASIAAPFTRDMGDPIAITIARASSSFTHTLTYKFGSQSGTIGTGLGASASWTPPVSLASQIPNASSALVDLVCITYQGSSEIGRKTSQFTLAVPSDVTPTISSVSVADQNPTVVSAVGAFVQGQSILKATVNASGAHGSSVKARSFKLDGVGGASGTTTSMPKSGTRSLTAEVTDSRGRKGTFSGNVSVLAYAAPKFNSFKARRSSSSGTLDDDGTSIRVDLNALVQSLVVSGSQKNSSTIRVYTRASGASSWTGRQTISGAALAYNSWFVIAGGANYPVSAAFDVRVTVQDVLKTSAAETSVSTARVDVHYGANGLGIGGYHTRGACEVHGQLFTTQMMSSDSEVRAATHVRAGGNLYLDGTMSSGSVPNARLTELSPGLTIATTPPVVTNADTAETPGLYILGSGATNSPDSAQEWSLQVIGNSTRKTQIATRIFGMARVYKRYRSGSPISWGSWQVTFDETSGDARMAAGSGSHDAVAASGGAVATTITFPSGRFSATPIATITNRGSGPTNRVTQMIQAISATSMTVWTSNWTAAASPSGNFHWIAIQVL